MKKLLSAIMVFTLIMSSIAATSVVTFAGTTNSTQLTNAIAAVKKVIEIPESLSEFEYYNDESDNNSMIHLNWSDKEHTSYVSAAVSDKGMITSYYSYLPEFEAKGLAKITRTQAEKVATAYLQKLAPNTVGSYKLEDNLVNDYGQDYTFTYKLYVNNIPCDFISASIGINKYAGKLSNYNCKADLKDLAITEYPLIEKTIAKEEAKKIYLSELGPQLKYFADYNYSKKSLKVFAAYETDGSNRAIDAKTGKVINLYNNYVIYRNAVEKGADKQALSSDSKAGEIQYSEEELKEIQRTQNLMDKNQADKTARNLISSIGSQKLQSSSLREDWGPNQEYLWNLNYEKCFVTLDAKNGTLINFNCSIENNSKNDIGLEKAKTIVENYLDKVCLDKKKQLVWTNENTIETKYDDYNFIYARQENGITFDDNSISVSVNKAEGTVVSYSRTWYENVTFPKLEGAIEKQKAFDIADNLGDFGLIYKKDFDGKVVLVYDFQKDGNYIIDAFKGVRLDYRGELYNDSAESDYTDITGNWAEKIIKELKNNGYYLKGDKFAPKAATTQIEFFKYLYSPEQNYYTDDEEFYKMLIANNIITKAEVNANAKITRQDAAKYITRYLGVDKLAKEASVFKNMYTDKVDNAYLGYASAVYALGIMKGDAKGRFNGGNTLSHSETAVIIYNILNKK